METTIAAEAYAGGREGGWGERERWKKREGERGRGSDCMYDQEGVMSLGTNTSELSPGSDTLMIRAKFSTSLSFSLSFKMEL